MRADTSYANILNIATTQTKKIGNLGLWQSAYFAQRMRIALFTE